MDSLFKILIIGDSGVGKTSILNRYASDMFNESFISTIGVDFKIKTMNIDGNNIKMQIWDTAGQERFRTITSSYYRGAHGIIVVFDVSDRESFLDVDIWMREIDNFCVNKKIQKILIGNKIDLERKVSYEEAHFLAMKYGITYLEVSAKKPDTFSQNTLDSSEILEKPIDNIFKILINNIINNKYNGPIHTFRDDNPIILFEQKEKKGCCF